MREELLIPGLITYIDLHHSIGKLLGAPFDRLAQEQMHQDFQTKFWGGAVGLTPRQGPRERQLDGAILQWTQAIEGFRTRYRHNLQPGRLERLLPEPDNA